MTPLGGRKLISPICGFSGAAGGDGGGGGGADGFGEGGDGTTKGMLK